MIIKLILFFWAIYQRNLCILALSRALKRCSFSICAVLLSKIDSNLANVFGHRRLHNNGDVERVVIKVEATSGKAVKLDGRQASLRQLRVHEVGEQLKCIEQDQDVSSNRGEGAAKCFQLVWAFIAHCDRLPKDVFVSQVFKEVSWHLKSLFYL